MMSPAEIKQLCSIALHALPLMHVEAQHEAKAIVAALNRPSTTEPLLQSVALAWEHDMQGVRMCIVTALHADHEAALAGLRKQLPEMLREVNRAPSLAAALAEGLAQALMTAIDEDGASLDLVTANAAEVRLSTNPVVTDAMAQWRSRRVFETDMSSSELRGVAREVKMRSVFSARTTNAEYLQEVATVIDEIQSGKINQATGRLRLMRKLKELGYDPAVGFPQDMAAIPLAERGSLQDLSSERRLNLMLETNLRMAANYGKLLAGNQPYERREYPAWELTRIYQRTVPRGTPQSHTDAWERRWTVAGESVNWEGAIRGVLIARKDSPIWQALGDGDGSTYTDTLGNPYPPFAFNSGMGWRAVSRPAWAAILGHSTTAGDPQEVPEPMQASLAPAPQVVRTFMDTLAPDLRAALLKEMEEDGDL